MKCELCGEPHELTTIAEHLRLMHPDEYGDGFETWPDGEPVVIDLTAETVADITEAE